MAADTPPNPYAADLDGRDPLDALADSPERIRHLLHAWPADRFDRSYEAGKWTARQILIHLAQTELALTTRARFAASQPDYTAQAFSQDDWMPLDQHADAAVALDAYLSLRRLNLAMWSALTADQRSRRFGHPEYGTLTVWWIAAQMAGHDIHHLRQLERIR
jgi:hypothetical protein